MNGTRTIDDYLGFIDGILNGSINEEYVRDNVIDFIKKRAILEGLQKSTVEEDGNKIIDIMEKAVRICDSVLFTGGYNYKGKVKERVEKRNKGIRAENQVPIAIDAIDGNTYGGLGSGELGCVGAPPGYGKTIFLCNVAKGACINNKNVIYFTMESNVDLLSGRIDHIVSQYDREEMRLKKDKLIHAVKTMPGNLILEEMNSSTTTLDLASRIQDFIVSGFSVDLVIADYIGVMSSTVSYKEPRHIIRNIANGLVNNIGKRFRVPVWTAHQVNLMKEEKDDQTKVYGLKDLNEAKTALAAECDYIIFMNQTLEEKRMVPQQLRISTGKNRLGEKDKEFILEMDMRRFIIRDSGKTSL
jgi:replicative DNA helicase